MKNKISVFVGIVNNVYVLTATNDGKNTYQFEPVTVKSKDEYYVLLQALIKTIKSFNNIEINFYSNNDSFAFEWEKEYLPNKSFSSTIKYYEDWNYIARLVESKKIKLRIKGESDMLSAISKKVRGKVFNANK